MKVLRGLKSSTNHESIRFPKVPDMLLPSDESALAKRQQQLQDYLNSILQYQVYRNHHEAVSTYLHNIKTRIFLIYFYARARLARASGDCDCDFFKRIVLCIRHNVMYYT